MFPNFKNLADKQSKRQELLRQIARDQSITNAQNEAYSETMWASDVANNTINLTKQTVSTQTDAPPGVFSTGVGTDPIVQSSISTNTEQEADDIGNENDSMSDIDDAEQVNAINEREKREKEAFDFLKNLFQDYPYLVAERLHPIKKGKVLKIAVLGPNLKLINTKSGKKSSIEVDTIDWELTKDYVLGKLQMIGVSRKKQASERSEMSLNDFNARPPMGDSSIGVDIEKEAMETLLKLYAMKPKEMLRLEPFIHPVGHTNRDQAKLMIYGDKRIKADLANKRLIVIGSNNRETPTMYPKISWANTLEFINDRARDMGISLDIEDLDHTYITPRKRLQSNSPELSRGRKSLKGVNAEIDAIRDADLRKLVQRIIQMNPWIDDGSTKFSPSVHTKNGVNVSPTYYLGADLDINDMDEPERGTLELYRKNGDRKATGSDKSKIMNSIDWRATYERLLDHLYFVKERTREAAVKKCIDKTFESINVIIDSGFRDDVETFRVKHNSKIKVEGRGLMGAGSQKYHVKNLKEATGISAFDYKPVGSKFIRLPDLHHNILNLKQPNRSSIGRKKKISPELTEVIKDLVYSDHINQQAYDKLSIEDKHIFTNILKITHLQWQVKDGWKDPNESLMAEYDKLVGEFKLGNNNPDLIRQLKSMTVDLYSQKLISDDDFKQVILSLI